MSFRRTHFDRSFLRAERQVPVFEGGTYRPPTQPAPSIACRADGVGGRQLRGFEGSEYSYVIDPSRWCGPAGSAFQIEPGRVPRRLRL